MSARTKVHGNRAIRCDNDGCEAVYVAAWWGNDAASARNQAHEFGWNYNYDPQLRQYRDNCPNHTKDEATA